MFNLLGVYHYDAHDAIVEWAFCLARFRPAVKPVEPLTRFYLSINRCTAGKLGLPVLPDLLVQADDVIE